MTQPPPDDDEHRKGQKAEKATFTHPSDQRRSGTQPAPGAAQPPSDTDDVNPPDLMCDMGVPR